MLRLRGDYENSEYLVKLRNIFEGAPKFRKYIWSRLYKKHVDNQKQLAVYKAMVLLYSDISYNITKIISKTWNNDDYVISIGKGTTYSYDIALNQLDNILNVR